MEPSLNKKKKRKFFGRKDRFLRQDFGQDIAKKLKSMSNAPEPTNQIEELKNDDPPNEILNPSSEKQKVLKNKRYEIKYSDNRVESFIKGLKLTDQEAFLSVPRKPCPQCKRNSHLYCPECMIPVINEGLVPKVMLPFPLTILWHQQEKKSKSSALPLKMLCAQEVNVIPFPESEVNFDEETTVFLYPHKNSRKLSEFSVDEIQNIKTVVAIECTWNQTNGILKELKNNKKNYKFVRLADYDTFFWRHQKHAEKCLATCEAIYYFYKEWEEAEQKLKGKKEYNYDGKFDNLLFYFTLQFKTILDKIE